MTDTSDPRLAAIELDQRTIAWRNADIDHERRVAVFDLLENNLFEPLEALPDGYAGPYRLLLNVVEGRLIFDISATDGRPLHRFGLALSPFRRLIRDYFVVCDHYYRAIRASTPSQIEAIDVGRRSLHNEAAERLIERLGDRLRIDFDTARRLFTLICVLHVR